MLRIVLSNQSEGIECLPFAFHHGARWFSEGKIDSPFLARYRKPRDPLAESHTTPDAAIGHFTIRPGTKRGLTLTADSKQFVVTEAKIFSKLKKDTTNAKYYDQAARTIACIAWEIGQSDRSVNDFESLGFYVIAPERRIARGIFSSQLKRPSIRKKVNRRVSAYVDDKEKRRTLRAWHKNFFIPVLDHIDIDCISWESIIDRIDNTSIRNFYDRCLEFNRQAKTKR
jgi:hypothetical protein